MRGARELLPPDRSTDTGMPIASRRAPNPGTDAEVNRDRVTKRPKRPVQNEVPLMRSRFTRPLTAPSGKTKSSRSGDRPTTWLSTNVQAGQRPFPRLLNTCGPTVDNPGPRRAVTGTRMSVPRPGPGLNRRPRTSRCAAGGSSRSTATPSSDPSGPTRRFQARSADPYPTRPTGAAHAGQFRGR